MYGMMFGDLGLALLVLLTGLWLRHRKLQFAILAAAAGGSGIVFGLLYGAALGHQIILAAWLKTIGRNLEVLRTALSERFATLRFNHTM